MDIAVFCLALMGTDYPSFLAEAHRVLKPRGHLWIAEVPLSLPCPCCNALSVVHQAVTFACATASPLQGSTSVVPLSDRAFCPGTPDHQDVSAGGRCAAAFRAAVGRGRTSGPS